MFGIDIDSRSYFNLATVIMIKCFVVRLLSRKIFITVPALFAMAFLYHVTWGTFCSWAMFFLEFLGKFPIIHNFNDAPFIVAHFHYIVATGVVFGILPGLLLMLIHHQAIFVFFYFLRQLILLFIQLTIFFALNFFIFLAIKLTIDYWDIVSTFGWVLFLIEVFEMYTRKRKPK